MHAVATAPRWSQLASRPSTAAAQLVPQRAASRRQPTPRLRWQPVTASFLSDIAGDPETFLAGTVTIILCGPVATRLGLELHGCLQSSRPAGSKWPTAEEGRARLQTAKKLQQQMDETKKKTASNRALLTKVQQKLVLDAATEECSCNEAE